LREIETESRRTFVKNRECSAGLAFVVKSPLGHDFEAR